MPSGYVLLKTATGRENEVAGSLENIPEIVEIVTLFGEYDIIARLEVQGFESLGKVVVDKIRAIEGVVRTRTLACDSW